MRVDGDIRKNIQSELFQVYVTGWQVQALDRTGHCATLIIITSHLYVETDC